MKPTSKKDLNIPCTSVIGSAYFGINVVLCIYSPLLSLFIAKYTDSNFVIGLMLTLGYIISAIVQPYFGARSDNTSSRMGRRKPYILVGMPLAAIFFFLIPYEQGFASLILFIVIFNVMLGVYRVPTMSLMPDLIKKEQWSNANGIINFMGGIGALVAYFLCSMLYNKDPHYPFIVGALVTLLSFALIMIFIKEKPGLEKRQEKKSGGAIKALGEIIKAQDKSALLILLSVFFRFLAYSGMEAFIVLYGIHHLGLAGSQGTYVLAIMSVTFIAVAIPSGIVATKFGKKRVITIGLVMFFAAMVGFIFVKSFLVMALISPLGGIGYALINTNVYPMLLGTADKSKVGAYAGLYYLAFSLAYIIGPTLYGKIIDMAGYGILFVFSAIIVALALLCFVKVKKDEITSVEE